MKADYHIRESVIKVNAGYKMLQYVTSLVVLTFPSSLGLSLKCTTGPGWVLVDLQDKNQFKSVKLLFVQRARCLP